MLDGFGFILGKNGYIYLVDLGRFGEIYRDFDEIWWILTIIGGFW